MFESNSTSSYNSPKRGEESSYTEYKEKFKDKLRTKMTNIFLDLKMSGLSREDKKDFTNELKQLAEES
jgi:hypothetical protein